MLLPSQEDDVNFVWLRAFPDEASRAPLRQAFYGGAGWLTGSEAQLLLTLDDHDVVVVQETADLWSRWPDQKR